MNPRGNWGTLMLLNSSPVAQPKVGGVGSCVQMDWMQNPCCRPPHHTPSQASATGVPGIHTLWERLCVCVCVYVVCVFYAWKQLNFAVFFLFMFFSFFLKLILWVGFCFFPRSKWYYGRVPSTFWEWTWSFSLCLLSFHCPKLESGALMKDDPSLLLGIYLLSRASSSICSRGQSQASLDMNLHMGTR